MLNKNYNLCEWEKEKSKGFKVGNFSEMFTFSLWKFSNLQEIFIMRRIFNFNLISELTFFCHLIGTACEKLPTFNQNDVYVARNFLLRKIAEQIKSENFQPNAATHSRHTLAAST